VLVRHLLAVLLLVWLLPFAQAADPVERVLENGLRVIVKQDKRAPTAVQLLVYRVGSIDETNGITGVSHALEHMMFKGTREVPAGEFSRRVAAMGGRENAFTSRDYTGYFQQIPKARLAEVMALEADRMANLVITADSFEPEREVVIEERRLRTEDRARALVYEQLMASALSASPARHPVIGWMSDLRTLTVQDLREWYVRWYSPSNAALVIAGDVDPQAVFELAQQHYGRIPARAVPPRKLQQEPAQRGLRQSVVKAPADSPYLLMAYRVPKLESIEGDLEPYALEMLAAVLSGDDTSRLVRELVRGSQVAVSASAGYDMSQRGPGLFTLAATPARTRSVEEVRQALAAQIARIAAEGVSEDELARIRTQYLASRVYQRDSLMSQAMEIAGLAALGLGWRDGERMIERIREVRPADVRAVAARYFADDTLTMVSLDPQPLDGARSPGASATRLRH
jgi:zinc protease